MQFYWYPNLKLEEAEKNIIIYTIKFCHNNKTAAAQMLGINPKTLGMKLAKYGLNDDGEVRKNRKIGKEGLDDGEEKSVS